MLLLIYIFLLYNLGTAVPLRIILAGRFNRTKTIRPSLQALSETHSKTQRFSKITVNESICYCHGHLMSSYTIDVHAAIFNPSTPADLEDPLRKELRSNWWCAGWSRTPGFHVIPAPMSAMSLLRFFITNASPNRVPTTRLVVPLATWLQFCDVKYQYQVIDLIRTQRKTCSMLWSVWHSSWIRPRPGCSGRRLQEGRSDVRPHPFCPNKGIALHNIGITA